MSTEQNLELFEMAVNFVDYHELELTFGETISTHNSIIYRYV